MSWTHFINERKNDRTKNKPWVHFRWYWHLNESGNKDISVEVCSSPSFGWGLDVSGDEGSVLIYFWFIFKFYIGFNRIFPEWIYPIEFNSYTNRDKDPNNKNLKGKARCRDTGWLRSGSRELSIRFFEYAMWWNIWRDDSSWDSTVPKWRHGSFHPGRIIRGNDKVSSNVIDKFHAQIKMPEGIYMAEVEEIKYIRTYQRWFSKRWKRFDFKFGYHDDDNNWIDTPVLHWGKGSESYNCGMDGTYSISLGSQITDRSLAVSQVLMSCLKYRSKYGDIDFPKDIKGIENGIVTKNLINEFK
jgi:hypothetical protein